MKRLRVVFYGSPAFAVASLQQLLAMDDVDVVAVVTQPDKPAGRKRALAPPAVKVEALRHGLPVYQYKKLRDGEAEAMLRSYSPDVAVVAAYGRILPKALLEVPTHGSINVHASLLPAWRGASPIAHAILHGDQTAGVCLMHMDEGLDTGAVYASDSLPIAPTDTTLSLTEKLQQLGARLLATRLLDIVAGRVSATPQPTVGVSFAPLLVKERGALDFRKDAVWLAREVRAFYPWPGSYLTYNNERVAVLSATAHAGAQAHEDAAPGLVLEASHNGLVVACGQGTLMLTRVKPAGRGEMTAGAWIAGRGPKKQATLPLPP